MRLDLTNFVRFRRATRRQPTLSIVCGTHHPGPTVAAALKPLRRVADEILVGADESVSEEDLAWYGSVADRLVTYPFTGPNQHRAWLSEQVSSDWLLFLDGDEIPSRALVDGIGSLLRRREIAGYLLRMWWVAPDGGHVLDSRPWSPEYHCRLVRQDDRLWFPGVKHSGPATRGPTCRSELSLLHLDLPLSDFDERSSKVAMYESQHFGHLTDGRSTNAQYYLPERRPDVALRPLESDDRSRVTEILSAGSTAARRPAAPRVDRRGTRDEVLRTVPWRPFEDTDAKASIHVVDAPAVARCGGQMLVEVTVANLGQRVWPCGWDTEPAIRLSYHWLRDGEVITFDGLRTALTHPIRGGEEIELTAVVRVPDDSRLVGGPSQLVFDIVAEGDRWFGCETTVTIEIAESARVELLDSMVGGLVPLDRALQVRADVGLPGELERQMGRGDQDVDLGAAEEILAGLPTGGWALDREVLAEVIRTFELERPDVVVEFGSGTSTVLLAWLARSCGRAVEVVSFEQDPVVADQTLQTLRARGLDHGVRVIVAPLDEVEVDGISLRSYSADVVHETLGDRSPGMVLVDGPSRADGGSRFPVLPMVQQHVRSHAILLLDDSWRDLELTIAERWAERSGVNVRGIAAIGKGLLVVDLDMSLQSC